MQVFQVNFDAEGPRSAGKGGVQITHNEGPNE